MASPAVDRKWLITELRRCEECELLFRTPTTSASESEDFYQTEYEEGFTTDLPSDDTLRALLASGFVGHDKNYDGYIAVLRALGVPAGAGLFDFGCSWGYGSHQLSRAGWAVDAFEISRRRAEFARARLGVSIRAPTDISSGSYDVFFSAHVIEHVPSVSAMIAEGMRLLRPGGLFIAFTPNGSMAFRSRNPAAWHSMWGQAHPQLIDERFLIRCFPKWPLIVTSAPLHQPSCLHPIAEIRKWTRTKVEPLIANLEQVELMFAVQKPAASPSQSG